MPYPHQHAARIKDPGLFEKGSFRTKKIASGISIIMGKLKGQSSMTAQAYRFDSSILDAEQARKWLKDHDINPISFEKASGETKMAEMVLADIYNDEYEDVNGIEILNIYPNTKNIKFTAEIFDEFINNFEKYKNEKTPHIKIDHTQQQAILKALTGKDFEEGTELPNLGLTKRLYHNGKSMYADLTKVPSKLKGIVFGGKMFKAISPEATWNYRGSGDKLITALALTNNPSQKHGLDIHLRENATESTFKEGRGNGVICFSGDIDITGGTSMADENKDHADVAAEQDVQLSEEAVQSISEKIFSKVSGIFGKQKEKDDIDTVDKSVSLSEYNKLKGDYTKLITDFDDIKRLLSDRESEHKKFSEKVQSLEKQTRFEKAEAISKQAVLDGVPKVVVDFFKPILLSEIGENEITLSEKVQDKDVEIKRSMTEVIKKFFDIYPDKIDFSDRTSTKLSEPGEGNQEELQLSEINKKAAEYVQAGMTEYAAKEKATVEVLTKNKGRK